MEIFPVFSVLGGIYGEYAGVNHIVRKVVRRIAAQSLAAGDIEGLAVVREPAVAKVVVGGEAGVPLVLIIYGDILEHWLVAQEHGIAGRGLDKAPIGAVSGLYATEIAWVNLLGDADVGKLVGTMLGGVVDLVGILIKMVTAHHCAAGEQMHTSAARSGSGNLVVRDTHIRALRLVCHSCEIIRFLCIKAIAFYIRIGNDIDCKPAVSSLVKAVATYIYNYRIAVGHCLVNLGLGVLYLEIPGYLLEHIIVRSEDKLAVSDRLLWRLDLRDMLNAKQALEGRVAKMYHGSITTVGKFVNLFYCTVVLAGFKLIFLCADYGSVRGKELNQCAFGSVLGHHHSKFCILCITVNRHEEFCLQLP